MAGAGSQGKGVLAHPQPCFVGLHLRVDIADRGLAMMVTIIDQQPDTQREGGRAQFGARQKAPGDMGRVGSLFEPDARFDTDQSDGEQPDGDRAIEMKGFEVDMTSRADCAATPAIGEERPARLAIDEVGIGLGPDKPAAERRLDGRDQQPVIAPGQAAGDGAAGIGAEPIGKPPLAALRLLQIAADGTAEADHRRGLKQHQQLQPQRVAVGIPGPLVPTPPQVALAGRAVVATPQIDDLQRADDAPGAHEMPRSSKTPVSTSRPVSSLSDKGGPNFEAKGAAAPGIAADVPRRRVVTRTPVIVGPSWLENLDRQKCHSVRSGLMISVFILRPPRRASCRVSSGFHRPLGSSGPAALPCRAVHHDPRNHDDRRASA